MNTLCLLVINCSPELEHELIDAFLSMPVVSGFTSSLTQGHGLGGAMTVAEQVAGRRERVQFEVMIAAADLDSCIATLTELFGNSGLVYWAYPLNVGGRLLASSQANAVPAERS
jgi:hypothetical protein